MKCICIFSFVGCTPINLEFIFWFLVPCRLPSDNRFIPAVGNGHVATQVYEDTIFINNVYNGFGNDSHRARIPSPVAVKPQPPGDNLEETYTLDMFRGSFVAHFDTDAVTVEQEIFSPRSRPHLLVNQITATRKNDNDTFHEIALETNWGPDSPDVDLTSEEGEEFTYAHGSTKEAEYNISATIEVHMFWTNIPDLVKLRPGEFSMTWRFITALGIEENEARAAYEEAVEHQEDLLEENAQSWKSLWESGQVVVEDNVTLAQTINACFFHIMISTPDTIYVNNPFAGLSPGKFLVLSYTDIYWSYNDYAGHVFWDMDTWIMPPIMQLYPDKAPIMISARTRVLDVAQQYAVETGYEGARYPWEQAYTGWETCPWDLAAMYQLHVNGDISYSVRQYLYATHDMDFARSDLIKELVMDIARFWKSRVDCSDEDKGCEIHGVMGPDENHYNVDNSVFTNYNTKLALTTPQYMMDIGDEIAEFNDIADQLYILFDEENKFHPQFEGFDHINSTIKQSDVVLLGYPLMMNMSQEVRQNDLVIYEELTDKYGPDTGTWSMHTVGWLELGNQEKANEMFSTMFRNVNGPFKIFSEKPPGSPDGQRAVNFITGMGGMLQAVFFGYGGIRQME
ncbi:hypothetical protein CAPTEDRAFT_112806, partial [Capitella teleta]